METESHSRSNVTRRCWLEFSSLNLVHWPMPASSFQLLKTPEAGVVLQLSSQYQHSFQNCLDCGSDCYFSTHFELAHFGFPLFISLLFFCFHSLSFLYFCYVFVVVVCVFVCAHNAGTEDVLGGGKKNPSCPHVGSRRAEPTSRSLATGHR